MTYTAGSVILAADYNTFAGNTTAGLNRVWSTGAGDAGWGQTDIATVATSGTVTATQWATIVNNLATSGTQTNTTLTSRTAPVTGNIIAILANVSTDITSVTTNRGNAVSSGTEYGVFSGTTSKTTATGSGQAAWTITFTHTVTFPSANQARYFWNAGGIVRLKYGKSSTGTDNDPEWNTLAGWCGTINLTGRVNGATPNHCGAGLHWYHTSQRLWWHTNNTGYHNRLVQPHRLAHYHIPVDQFYLTIFWRIYTYHSHSHINHCVDLGHNLGQ
jgi:hypothetical protein